MDRRGYLGASDVPVVLGKNLFKTAFEIWEEKTGRVENTFTGNLATRIGHHCESLTAAEFNNRTLGRFEIFDPEDKQFDFKEWPVLKVRPDFLLTNKKTGEKLLLECKTAFKKGGQATWAKGCPIDYYYQVQTQLLAMGYERGYIAAITEGNDFFCYEIKADLEIQDEIINALKIFWDCVQQEKPPAFSYENKKKEYKSEISEIDAKINRVLDLKGRIKELETEQNEIKAELNTALIGCDGYKHEGLSATWVHRAPALRFSAATAEKYLKERLSEEQLKEFYNEGSQVSYLNIKRK